MTYHEVMILHIVNTVHITTCKPFGCIAAAKGRLRTMDAGEKDLDYFIVKFNELADDARDHGMSVAILIENADPISRQSSVSKIFRGTVITSIGLLQSALMDFHKT